MLLAWAAVLLFLAAAVRDIGWRIIDDRLVLCLMLAWGGHAVLAGWDTPLLLSHLAVAVLAFVVTLACGMVGWMGGGDVKLAAAVFLWAGPGLGLPVLSLVAMAGLAVAILALAARLLGRLPLPAAVGQCLGIVSSERGVPYGVALAVGGMAAALLAPVGG